MYLCFLVSKDTLVIMICLLSEDFVSQFVLKTKPIIQFVSITGLLWTGSVLFWILTGSVCGLVFLVWSLPMVGFLLD